MFKFKNLMLMLVAAVVVAGCSTQEQSKSDIKTDMDKASYAIGFDIGSSLKSQDVTDLNLDLMYQGMVDAQSGEDTLMTQDEMMAALQTFQDTIMQRQQEKAERETTENLAAGEAFLAENATKEGVQITESGLQYRVIEEGSGANPSATSSVTVHYRGTLIDGTEFDSSYSRGEPATFGLNQVIPGWTEGLQLMNVGSKYEFVIPSDLGYGERGTQGGSIGPNATLIFQVELISIN
jgi:FKBP-type peptidyl-prolyl cis-trans isomerase